MWTITDGKQVIAIILSSEADARLFLKTYNYVMKDASAAWIEGYEVDQPVTSITVLGRDGRVREIKTVSETKDCPCEGKADSYKSTIEGG